MVDALAIGLVLPPLAALLGALVYRAARGTLLRLSRRTGVVLVLVPIPIGLLALGAMLSNPSASGLNIPLALALACSNLVFAILMVSKLEERQRRPEVEIE